MGSFTQPTLVYVDFKYYLSVMSTQGFDGNENVVFAKIDSGKHVFVPEIE